MAKRKSTKGQTTIYKTKDRVTRTPLKTGGELRCSGRVHHSIRNKQQEKVQKDKQRSTKHTYKTKDGVTRTPLKTGGSTQVPRKGTIQY